MEEQELKEFWRCLMLEQLVKELQKLVAAKEALEAQISRLREDILNLMLASEVHRVDTEVGSAHLSKAPFQVECHDVKALYDRLGPRYVTVNTTAIRELVNKDPETLLSLVEQNIISIHDPPRLWKLTFKPRREGEHVEDRSEDSLPVS